MRGDTGVAAEFFPGVRTLGNPFRKLSIGSNFCENLVEKTAELATLLRVKH
jgi:hypothetical protein